MQEGNKVLSGGSCCGQRQATCSSLRLTVFHHYIAPYPTRPFSSPAYGTQPVDRCIAVAAGGLAADGECVGSVVRDIGFEARGQSMHLGGGGEGV